MAEELATRQDAENAGFTYSAFESSLGINEYITKGDFMKIVGEVNIYNYFVPELRANLEDSELVPISMLELPTYQIFFSALTAGGTVSAANLSKPQQLTLSGSVVNFNDIVRFSATPFVATHDIDKWYVDGSEITVVGSFYTKQITKDIFVGVSFKPKTGGGTEPNLKHKIYFSASGNGSITASIFGQGQSSTNINSGYDANAGDLVTFTLIPMIGYKLSKLTINTKNVTNYIIGNQYTIAVSSAITAVATFVAN